MKLSVFADLTEKEQFYEDARLEGQMARYLSPAFILWQDGWTDKKMFNFLQQKIATNMFLDV